MKHFLKTRLFFLLISCLFLSYCASEDDGDSTSSEGDSNVSVTVSGTVVDEDVVPGAIVFLDEDADGEIDDNETYITETNENGDFTLTIGTDDDITIANVFTMFLVAVYNDDDGNEIVLISSAVSAVTSILEANGNSGFQPQAVFFGNVTAPINYITTVNAFAFTGFDALFADNLQTEACGDDFDGVTFSEDCYVLNATLGAVYDSITSSVPLAGLEKYGIANIIAGTVSSKVDLTSSTLLNDITSDVAAGTYPGAIATKAPEAGIGSKNLYYDITAITTQVATYIATVQTQFSGTSTFSIKTSKDTEIAAVKTAKASMRSNLKTGVGGFKPFFSAASLRRTSDDSDVAIFPPQATNNITNTTTSDLGTSPQIVLTLSADQRIIDSANSQPIAITSVNTSDDQPIFPTVMTYDSVVLSAVFTASTGDQSLVTSLTYSTLSAQITPDNSRDTTPLIQIVTSDSTALSLSVTSNGSQVVNTARTYANGDIGLRSEVTADGVRIIIDTTAIETIFGTTSGLLNLSQTFSNKFTITMALGSLDSSTDGIPTSGSPYPVKTVQPSSFPTTRVRGKFIVYP